VRSARFRPVYQLFYFLLVIACFGLGYAGAHPPEGLPVIIGQVSAVYYFLFFLVITPVLSRVEKARPLPASIADAVLKKSCCAAALLALVLVSAPASASEGSHLMHREWPHHGVTGTFDRAALQRGFQVYKEICASCHSLQLLSYRNLEALGYNEDEVKAIAAQYQVAGEIDDEGNPTERPALPSDRFKSPFANDNAARAANGGALPPDLSLIVKARQGHENFIYSLLTGYGEAPASLTLMQGMNYNATFPGNQIAMPAPLTEGGVTFADGTPATVDQMAADVTQFLAWAGDPHMEERKQTGLKVMIFLVIFASVMYAVKRKVWSDLH
jgi:cytochrome c1